MIEQILVGSTILVTVAFMVLAIMYDSIRREREEYKDRFRTMLSVASNTSAIARTRAALIDDIRADYLSAMRLLDRTRAELRTGQANQTKLALLIEEKMREY